MTSFQSRVVHALLGPVEPAVRPAVQAFVEDSLADMPHHLRLGIGQQRSGDGAAGSGADDEHLGANGAHDASAPTGSSIGSAGRFS